MLYGRKTQVLKEYSIIRRFFLENLIGNLKLRVAYKANMHPLGCRRLGDLLGQMTDDTYFSNVTNAKPTIELKLRIRQLK